ncbi:MAG: CARDB domain-containing protein [Nanoarchaeota archaeon]
MNRKTINWLAGIGLLVLLFSPLSLALGIQPAKTTIIASETASYQGHFMVVNNEAKKMAVHIRPEGVMAQYIKVFPEEITFRSDDPVALVEVKVELPEFLPPGVTNHYIVVEEDSDNYGEAMSSKLLLRHKITIQGEYPDKYVEVKINVHDQGNELRLVSEVQNLGKLDLQEVKTTFYLNDKEQKEQTLETEVNNLAAKETTLLEAKIGRSLFDLGEYTISAVTKYDDLEVERVQQFQIGQPEVEVTYFSPYFIVDQVNRYTMGMLNKWNKQVKNVFVDVTVKKDDKLVEQFRTKSVDINALMSKQIEDYLDARDKQPGRYSFEMAVNFWDNVRMKSKTFESEIITEEEMDSLNTDDLPLATGKAVGNNNGGSSFLTRFLGSLVLILIMIIGSYIFYRYLHRKEYE